MSLRDIRLRYTCQSHVLSLLACSTWVCSCASSAQEYTHKFVVWPQTENCCSLDMLACFQWLKLVLKPLSEVNAQYPYNCDVEKKKNEWWVNPIVLRSSAARGCARDKIPRVLSLLVSRGFRQTAKIVIASQNDWKAWKCRFVDCLGSGTGVWTATHDMSWQAKWLVLFFYVPFVLAVFDCPSKLWVIASLVPPWKLATFQKKSNTGPVLFLSSCLWPPPVLGQWSAISGPVSCSLLQEQGGS